MNIKFCIKYGPEGEVKDSKAAAKFLREHTNVKKARLRWTNDRYEGTYRYAYVNSDDARWWGPKVYCTPDFNWVGEGDLVIEFKKNYMYVGHLYE